MPEQNYKFGELIFTLKFSRTAGDRRNALSLISKYRKILLKTDDVLEGYIELFYPEFEIPLFENGVIVKDENGKEKTEIEVRPAFKEIFETVLDGELDKIDYTNFMECERLARECLTGFFTLNS
jgi:hypothetical protein